MKKIILPLLCLFFATFALGQQVGMSCRLAHTQHIPFAPIPAEITIENRSSIPLLVGGSNGQPFSFEVTRRHFEVLPVLTRPFARDPFEIAPGERVTRTVDLRASVDLRETGQYTVVARLDWGGQSHLSNKNFLTIRKGIERKRVEVVAEDGEAPFHRTFTLSTLDRDRRFHSFLRVDDESRGLCFGVFELGPIILITPPVLVVDERNYVNLLQQSAPDRYTHAVFSPEGRLVQRTEHRGVGYAELVPGDNNSLKVSGLREADPSVLSPGGRGFSGADLLKTPR